MTILYAAREVVTWEKIADHAPSGHLWLVHLVDGTTVPAFGHELEVPGATRSPDSRPTVRSRRGLVLVLALSLAPWVPIVWGAVWLVQAVIA
ncbi:hypothetical protein [Rhodococcus ruber]|uniref:hypothetical protein n=1 Tax=Rhodococcus ruber TaxID=1830 RepID=UPI003D815993